MNEYPEYKKDSEEAVEWIEQVAYTDEIPYDWQWRIVCILKWLVREVRELRKAQRP